MLHKWIISKDTGIHLYLKCNKCGQRNIKRVSKYGYQPIDQDWIASKNMNSLLCTKFNIKED